MNQYGNAQIRDILNYLTTSGYHVSASYTHSYFNVSNGLVFVSFCVVFTGDIYFRRYDYTHPYSYGQEIDSEEFYILFPRRVKGKG